MACSRNKTLIKNELIRYISSLGIDVNTITKARGNKGFFKEGRIDVSKSLDDDNSVMVLVHEFAHFINFKLDNTLKDFKILFEDDSDIIKDELLSVTIFVDENALCRKLNSERDKLNTSIKSLTDKIKLTYPNFSRSEEFKEFKKFSRWSDISYLEKYDRVKIHNLFSSKIYSLSTIKKDFPDTPEVFIDYLKLKSQQRKRAKISRKISRMNKYYNAPSELFARFIEGLYLDIETVKELAPNTYSRFIDLYNKNHYDGLRELFSILGIIL